MVLPPVATVDVEDVFVVVAVVDEELDEDQLVEATTLVVFWFAVVVPPVETVVLFAACEAQPARMRHAKGKRMSLMDFFIR